MKSLNDYEKEIEKYPKGYISIKTINKKKRYYLQWREDNKIKSKYIPAKDVPLYQEQIKNFKELEEKIRQYISILTPAPELSKNHLSLTGSVMAGNKKVATFENGKITFINKEFAPLYIVRTNDVRTWLERRAIDSHRANSRLLKKALGIRNTSDLNTSLEAHGATITDNYWFKAKFSSLKYSDILFNNDYFSDLALTGNFSNLKARRILSPELTNIGSYEKCWKLINGSWWMYKNENENQRFSEIFIYLLGKTLGFNMAIYELDGSYIKTKNFADKENFEPMSSLMDENEDYNDVFNVLDNISEDIAKDYLKLIWFDSLVFNQDRHNENYGLMRNKETGKIESLAPNFDNNIALISNGFPNKDRKKDGLISFFKELLKKNKTAKRYYSDMSFPLLTDSIISDCLNNCPLKTNNEFIHQFLMNGYEVLMSLK